MNSTPDTTSLLAYCDTLCQKPVDWVFFDLGNLLFKIDHTQAWENTMRHSPLPLDEAMSRFQNCGAVIEALTGCINDKAFFQIFADLIGFTDSPDLLSSYWEPVYQPIANRLNVLAQVQRSFHTGILSNITSFHSHYLEQHYPVLRETTRRVYSWETGFVKPRPEIFDTVIRLSQTPADRILFVDDHPGHTQAAQERGFQTLTVSPEDELAHVLSPWTHASPRRWEQT